jgi:hypothetical protein
MLRIAFPLVFLGWLPFGYIVGAVFRFLNWNEFIAGIIILAWIPLILIVGWPWPFWKCPQCGSAFKGIYDPFFPKHCRHCGLPKWGESRKKKCVIWAGGALNNSFSDQVTDEGNRDD